MGETAAARRVPRRRVPLLALLAASGVSIAGDTLTAVAIPWFVLQTTGSAAKTGLAAFVSTAPIVISAGLAGVLADRLGYRRVSIGADLATAVLVAAIPALHVTVGLTYWGLLLLLFARWLLATPGSTAREALVPELATAARTSLERASSAYDGVSRAARMVGAPLAGALVAFIGAANLLFLDAASFTVSGLVIAAAVTRIREPVAAHGRRYLDQLREGLAYAWKHRLLRAIVAMVLVTNMLDAAYAQVLLPLYARRVLGSALALGAIAGVFGAGAVLGTVVFGAVGARLPRRWTYTVAFLVGGSPRFAVLLPDPGLLVILVTAAVCGFAVGAINPLLSTVTYERVPGHLRARVLGALNAGAFAAMPLGGLFAGTLAEGVGLRVSLAIAGGVYLAATLAPAFGRVWRGMDARLPLPASDADARVPSAMRRGRPVPEAGCPRQGG